MGRSVIGNRLPAAGSDKRGAVRNQQGQVLAWIVVAFPLLLALVGLVFDGGLLWAQFRRARWALDGAAVAAASEIDAGLFQTEGRVVLQDGAVFTAVRYAQENDPNLHVANVYVQANTVYVQGWVEVQPVFLGMIGVDSLRLDVRGQERPRWGGLGETGVP